MKITSMEITTTWLLIWNRKGNKWYWGENNKDYVYSSIFSDKSSEDKSREYLAWLISTNKCKHSSKQLKLSIITKY